MKDVIYITTPERAASYKWDPKSDKLSSNLEIMSIDELEAEGKLADRSIFPLGTPEKNTIYIRDYVSNVYYPSTVAEEKLALSKEQAIDFIASLLGVKELSRKVDSVSEVTRACDANGVITCKYVNLDAGQHSERREQIAKRYQLNRSYESGETDFEAAEEYAAKTGLIHDQFVRDLLLSRNPSRKNRLSRHKMIVELTSQIEDLQEAAFSLSVLGGIFKCGAKYRESVSTMTRIKLEYELIF